MPHVYDEKLKNNNKNKNKNKQTNRGKQKTLNLLHKS